MVSNPILAALDDPTALETLYQTRPVAFAAWLEEAVRERADSETLRVWQARLGYRPAPAGPGVPAPVLSVVLLGLTAGLLMRLPGLVGLDLGWYLARFAGLIIVGSLIIWCLLASVPRVRRIGGAALFVCVLFAWLLPDRPGSDSITMALIHLPLVALSLLAWVFMTPTWRDADARIRFIAYLGELLTLVGVILLGGVLLTMLTLGLFSLIELRIDDWYLRNVVVFGLAAAPVVGTWVYDDLLHRQGRLAVIVARLFAPLVLLTVVAYLAAILMQGRMPWADREFLIIINGLLLAVLAITLFAMVGRQGPGSRAADAVVIGLVAVTLSIDVLALGSILLRWAEYGVTPNRVAVTGANLLIFIHLLRILAAWVPHLGGSPAPSRLLARVTGFLPAYSAWSLFVVIGLPLGFGWR